MIGTTLGHYEITSQLGKGGMGEVYRAKDRKLGRDVAIKVLPEEFARDADRVARFQREAKLLASLNHPNIAAIYGLEEAAGSNFLVLELVEGETLAEYIAGSAGVRAGKNAAGTAAVPGILNLALQIAEALEAAHEKGVIHRDLKPANIRVTPEGKIKVLDFGLAKAYAGEQEQLNLSNSPTLSDAATRQGVILGTAAYMSPEQARGKVVDKRADIWAFGSVMFEMLTGRAAFSGRDVTEILAAVIRSDPDWSKLPANLHWRLRELLERCLEKEVGNRYGSIADARVDIQKTLADPGGALVQPFTTVQPRNRLRKILPWTAAALILGLILAGVAVWKLKPPEPKRVVRFDCDLPEDQQFTNPIVAQLAVSPDGTQFAYSTSKGLYLRSMSELTARLIPGTEGDSQQPFFSPDGKWIGYFSSSDRQLKKISVSGGAPIALCAVSQLAGAWWGSDNAIVYGQLSGDMMRISAGGGTPESLIQSKVGLIVFPQLLPDGESVLYTASPTVERRQMKVMVQSLKSGKRKELFAGINARYLSTGQLVYQVAERNNIFAIPFNPDKLEVTGGPVPMIEGVLQSGGVLQYAVSDSGTLVYMPARNASAAGANQSALFWVDRNGKEQAIAAPARAYGGFKISPDGSRVALAVETSGNDDIWIWDLIRETLTRLTFDEVDDSDPLWTRDGKRIAFFSNRKDTNGVYWKAADGTGVEELIGSSANRYLFPWSWSPDGKFLAMTELKFSPTFSADIGVLSMEDNRKRIALLEGKYMEADPQISPDGRWIAYTSNESGASEIFVRPFPEVNRGRWQISTGGGAISLWSPDGRELFYRSGDAVVAVKVERDPTFKPGRPEVLFRGAYVPPGTEGISWDISPDGKRFLMMKETGNASGASAEGETKGARPRKINIVLNWLEELKQRVSVK